MNSDFVPIGQASKILGVSIQTLRNWGENRQTASGFCFVWQDPSLQQTPTPFYCRID